MQNRFNLWRTSPDNVKLNAPLCFKQHLYKRETERSLVAILFLHLNVCQQLILLSATNK